MTFSCMRKHMDVVYDVYLIYVIRKHMQLVRRILWSCFLKLNMYLRTHTMHVAFQSFFINSSRYLTALV